MPAIEQKRTEKEGRPKIMIRALTRRARGHQKAMEEDKAVRRLRSSGLSSDAEGLVFENSLAQRAFGLSSGRKRRAKKKIFLRLFPRCGSVRAGVRKPHFQPINTQVIARALSRLRV